MNDYSTKIKALSKAVDVKSASLEVGIKSTSNVWSGKASNKKLKKLYKRLVERVFIAMVEDS